MTRIGTRTGISSLHGPGGEDEGYSGQTIPSTPTRGSASSLPRPQEAEREGVWIPRPNQPERCSLQEGWDGGGG